MMNVRCVGKADETKILHDSIYSHGKFRAIELNIEVVCKEFYTLQAIEATMHTRKGMQLRRKNSPVNVCFVAVIVIVIADSVSWNRRILMRLSKLPLGKESLCLAQIAIMVQPNIPIMVV